jgi:hypothetical protein
MILLQDNSILIIQGIWFDHVAFQQTASSSPITAGNMFVWILMVPNAAGAGLASATA